MKIQTPNYLQKGDSVAIISTARKISLDEIKPAIELLETWGLKVVVGKTIGLENNQFAGTLQERIDDLQDVLDDATIKAIWCARGGYGTVQLMDKIDFSIFKKNPKWIIGYSDITVLHAHIHNFGIETVHATMPINISKNSEDAKESLKNALLGNQLYYEFPSHQLNISGKPNGEIIGGNLSVLYSLLGSKSSINTKNKLLFLEDLDEYLYHIDRMLQNLKRNGYFENVSGIIVGGMTQMRDNDIPFGKTAEEIILEIVKPYNIPVIFGAPFGHLDDNRTLIFGRNAQLISDEKLVQIIFDN
ncbi:MAG TPA: LD-carboxypeptidase [Flavobacteriaceae bacterium]|nr:LD-carboxypeptidase [Flavobacteriaceae bacterium]